MTCGIDVHTHVAPENFPAYRGSDSSIAWPSMEQGQCGHGNIIIAGKLFRTVRDAAWSAPRRIADIAQMELTRQVISPMPELLSYWLPLPDAVVLLRHVNAAIAAMVEEAPAHFVGMGAVPLQDVDTAIAELRYNKEVLGLRAVEVGSNVNGAPIGDPRFEPFLAAAEAMGVAVFVHALRAAKDRLCGPPLLEQIVAFPSESALAAASLITSGVLARHPRLRIAFSHGGGGFGVTLARMEHFWTEFPRFTELLAESPLATARRAYYDLTVFDPVVVRALADQFGVDQLLLGSDYPFGAYEKKPLELLRRAGFDEAQAEAVRCHNACRYLDIAPTGDGSLS